MLLQNFQLLGPGAVGFLVDGGDDEEANVGLERLQSVQYVFRSVFLDRLAADGRDGGTDACVQQAQVVVDFGPGGHRGAWTA